MAYPQAQEPELAKETDRISKRKWGYCFGNRNKSGLLWTFSCNIDSVCIDVDYIKAERINDLFLLVHAVMSEQGRISVLMNSMGEWQMEL